jgi:hypothetical protein
MTKKQKELMYRQIEKHGKDLLALFPDARIKDPVLLCKALRRMELKARKAAENWCNGLPGPEGETAMGVYDYWHGAGEHMAEKAVELLGDASPGNEDIGIVFNGDARGYALKISAVEHDFCGLPDTAECRALYKGRGGYGIVAPDFSPRT